MKILDFIRNKVIRRFINLRNLSAKQVAYDEIIRIELLVAMCLITITSGFVYIIIGAFLGVSFLIIVNYLLFFLIVVPVVLYVIKKGFHNQAKLIMMIIGSLFMFIKAASLGRDSGMNLSMMIIIFATFAFYSIKDYKYIFLSQAGKIQKNIRIHTPFVLYSDPYRIKTVLNNLISNSFKYYRKSEETSFIDIDISSTEHSTIILIKDNGIGIASEYLKNIFEMFYRATNKSKGSGLGLYIVKEMVENLMVQ